jgi:hypothetical protein
MIGLLIQVGRKGSISYSGKLSRKMKIREKSQQKEKHTHKKKNRTARAPGSNPDMHVDNESNISNMRAALKRGAKQGVGGS